MSGRGSSYKWCFILINYKKYYQNLEFKIEVEHNLLKVFISNSLHQYLTLSIYKFLVIGKLVEIHR